ncbi:MAG: DNA adenine methylase [Candidatus Margulisbacteria bacterium]|jgi:DNA adenine methylase/adenine-specific DNA-methyltransferase|nr:DNA adenine methylase [Candidatus Margulisiibacteriota bacterium]
MSSVVTAKEKKQSRLFDIPSNDVFPSTRYQGSKYKILQWIDWNTKELRFNSVLDAFGGTGCVGYMYKKKNKQIFYNDYLKFNFYIGRALIENQGTVLTKSDVQCVLRKQAGRHYPTFIYDTFKNIYFADEENKWLDIVVTNIGNMTDKYKQSLAYYALFQACIIKRPYNLFHRKNLYIRTADVERSFGNKKTWDASFDAHFLKFVTEANAAVFSNEWNNKAVCADVFDLDIQADLVYIDTPYISAKGTGVNYFDFYHFLEGLVFYEKWPDLIDKNSKHKKMKNGRNEWCSKNEICQAFDRLFCKFQNSILIVSYRDDGLPSVDILVEMLRKYKQSIEIKKLEYRYVLSNAFSREALIIAR